MRMVSLLFKIFDSGVKIRFLIWERGEPTPHIITTINRKLLNTDLTAFRSRFCGVPSEEKVQLFDREKKKKKKKKTKKKKLFKCTDCVVSNSQLFFYPIIVSAGSMTKGRITKMSNDERWKDRSRVEWTKDRTGKMLYDRLWYVDKQNVEQTDKM